MKSTHLLRSGSFTSAKNSGPELLDEWLSLSIAERTKLYADTALAAERAGVSRRTIQDWIAEGKVMALRVGKKYYVRLKSMESHLHDCLRG